MKAFENFRGKVAPLDRANVDTDAIIPKQFLKSIRRTGFGELLFYDWRYLPDGKPNPQFILKSGLLPERDRACCEKQFWLWVKP